MNERIELQYWNEIYRHKEQEKPQEDRWLDKYAAILEQSVDTAIIDLGCGSGLDTAYLIGRGHKVIACDLSDEALQQAARLAPGAVLQQLNLLEGLPFATGSAKIIVADLSLHYFTWADTSAIVLELQRVLHRGGALLCRLNSVMDKEFGAGQGREIEPHFYEFEGRFKRFFDEEEIRRLFEQWSMEHLEHSTMHRYGKPKWCWDFAAVHGG